MADRRRISRARAGSPPPPDTQEALPSETRRPSTVPSIPEPGSSCTSTGNESERPRCRAARTMAAPRTWGETWSSEAASRRSSSGSTPANTSMSATSGMPEVRVPVLSNSSTDPRASVSSAPPPFTMMPRRAAREIPATMAIGAAKISGQGVATTSTASARTGSPVKIHAPAAMTRVTGTNRSAYRSARRTNGAFCFSASSISRTIPA